MDELTDEQRRRAERNRLAALAKRKAATTVTKESTMMGFFKCQKISPDRDSLLPPPPPPAAARFRVRLEICSPDSFSLAPAPLPPHPYPGEAACLKKISSWLSFVEHSHYTQSHGGQKSSVYKLQEYDAVLKCLKRLEGVELQEIPWRTLNVVQKFSQSFIANRWVPCIPEHLSDEEVDALLSKLPKVLFDALLPFQLDGVRYGLRRGGSCLIADEMGLGKTIQAIAIACCFMNHGSILVVCPAILRYSWAEELERWLPILSPTDIHLVFGHKDDPSSLTRCPKVVIISYTMLHHLRKSMLALDWAILIVDESHHVRCTKRASEPGEITAVLDIATKVKRKVLLSGTPSLSRPYDIFHQIDMLWPGLLGTSKYEFAKTYCEPTHVKGFQGKVFQDFSKGVRLEELNVLLKQTVMIRRLKEHLLRELPHKRRQIIRLVLTRSDINMAMATMKAGDGCSMENRQAIESVTDSNSFKDDADAIDNSDNFSDTDEICTFRSSRQLSFQELGIAKLSGFEKWLSIHPIVAESECEGDPDTDLISHKMLIFAHHLKVLDRVQSFLCEKNIKFVRIDGKTLERDRQLAVQEFRSSQEVKIAIIGITAGGTGVDFSSAQHVVFLELPQSVSEMLQAEDRAHRRGQTNAVNIYIFCAKDTLDELRWPSLNKSLKNTSSTMNGKYDAVQEIAISEVTHLGIEEGWNKPEKSEENKPDETTASDADTDVRTDNTTSDIKLQKIEDGEDSDENMINSTFQIGGLKPCTSGTWRTEKDEEMEKMTIEPCQTDERPVQQHEADLNSVPPDSLQLEDGEDLDEDMINSTFQIGGLKPCSATWRTEKDEEMEKVPTEPYQADERLVQQPIEPYQTDEGLIQQHEADLSSVPPDSLRFEVSKVTGRVHLYTCIPGKDLTPRQLFENFRPEEFESPNPSVADESKKKSQILIHTNPGYKHVISTFIKEWNDLRPVERRKLFGKPLRCPLGLELCFLQDSIYHSDGGLLKTRSKRRVTPLSEISHPLPENAVWKSVSICNRYGKKEKQYKQGWTIAGEPLCKLCQMPCKGKFAEAPEMFDHLFCQVSCMEVFRTRTSQSFLREELSKIEHGVCSICKLDCHKLVQSIRPLSVARRKKYIMEVAPKIAFEKALFDRLVKEPKEGNAWHADHIVAVHKGGGECTVDNLRTLCVACHKEVTAAQAADRRLARIDAKKRLKQIMRGLKDDKNAESTSLNIKDEDELLVKVPGSSYSETEHRSSTRESVAVDNENPSTTTENDEQKDDEDELLVKVPGSAYPEIEMRGSTNEGIATDVEHKISEITPME